MSRDWPAKDMATMITLIDDPRHRVSEDGTARLSLEQAKAILDLRLQRLTALGREEISEELTSSRRDRRLFDILRSRARIQSIIKDELTAVKDEFATPRRTMIIDQEGEVEDEDLIQREDMVVTVSHAGYVKRVPLSTYRAQKRGGKGRVQACRRAMRISSAGCSSPRRIRRCCSSRPAGRSTRRRSGGCRWPLRTHAARR
jgi:DNA gyrase subunit A